MPNLKTELSHLAQADFHIAKARENIARMSRLIARNSAAGSDVDESQKVLETMKETLAAFQRHRAYIVQTIQDIDAGSLPGI